MEKDLEIVTSLDQHLSVDHQDILEEVEIAITNAVQSKDVEVAFEFCKRMIGQMKRSGIALAKALWMINKNWNIFMIGDEFIPTTQEYTGLHYHTIERYVKVWEMLTNYVPASFKEEIEQKNIKSLIPIANAIAQGYEVQDDEWERLAKAPDFNEISRIVREEIKDEAPRKNNLMLKLDGRGSIWAYTNEGAFFVGSLEIEDDNPTVKKAVERIVSNSGILKG